MPKSQSSSASSSLGDELYEKAKQRKGGQEPSRLDIFNEAMHKAAEETGQIKDYGNPRVVEKGKKPEIVIKGESIYVNGHALKIGDPIEKWRTLLGKESRVYNFGQQLLIWDDLGISLSTLDPADKGVSGISVHLGIAPLDMWETAVTVDSQGKKMPPPRQYDPKHPFPGYLELDGFGIDAQTKFWEIRANANPKRNLNCGLTDCSHPSGLLSDTATMYLRLNRGDEYGTIYEISLPACSAYADWQVASLLLAKAKDK